MTTQYFATILCSVGFVLLALSFPAEAVTTVNMSSFVCYANETACIKTCKHTCYFIDNCNGEPNRYGCLPFSPTLFIIIIVAVCLGVSLCCCCCVGVIICLVVRAKRRRTQGQVVFDGKAAVVQQPAP